MKVYPEATTRRMIERFRIGLAATILFLPLNLPNVKADEASPRFSSIWSIR